MPLTTKDFYPINEACKLSGCAVDDLLHLAEQDAIALYVAADNWPMQCGHYDSTTGSIAPFDVIDWVSGYCRMIWTDVAELRRRGSVEILFAWVTNWGDQTLGCILVGTNEFRGRRNELTITAEQLWLDAKSIKTLRQSNLVHFSNHFSEGARTHPPSKQEARKIATEYKKQIWRDEYARLKQDNKRLTKSRAAELIAKQSEHGRGYKPGTIRKALSARK